MQYVTCIQIRNITSIKVKRWDVIKMPKLASSTTSKRSIA